MIEHWLDRGMNIIPVEVNGKKPLIRWEGFQEERVTPEQIKGWWRRWPQANVGLLCGRINGVVSRLR